MDEREKVKRSNWLACLPVHSIPFCCSISMSRSLCSQEGKKQTKLGKSVQIFHKTHSLANRSHAYLVCLFPLFSFLCPTARCTNPLLVLIVSYDRSNPAPLSTLYTNLSLNLSFVLYLGNFNRFTHVLVLGKRSSPSSPTPAPESRMLNRGFK